MSGTGYYKHFYALSCWRHQNFAIGRKLPQGCTISFPAPSWRAWWEIQNSTSTQGALAVQRSLCFRLVTPISPHLTFLQRGATDDVNKIDDVISQSCQQLAGRENVKNWLASWTNIVTCLIAQERREPANFDLTTTQIRLISTRKSTKHVIRWSSEEESEMIWRLWRTLLTFQKYVCNSDVKRAHGGGPVVYLMKYAFKPGSMTNAQMRTKLEGDQTSRDLVRGKVWN